MDMKDIEKEFGDFKLPYRKPRKRIDMSVEHAGLKVILSKVLAALFILAVALFAMYTVVNAKNAHVDVKIVGALSVVYLALGAYISSRLWNLELIGWVAMFFVSLAGIAIPVMSAVTSGIAIGTIPIVAVSVVSLAVLWWIRDLYRIKKFRDIFSPPQ